MRETVEGIAGRGVRVAACAPAGRVCFAVAAIGILHTASVAPAAGATLTVCRTFDIASPLMSDLVIPAHSLFRDNGRTDDPLRAFTEDRWQLRLETIVATVLPPLERCVPVLVRITSDSAVRSVAATDNRTFVYAGSNDLLDETPPSEDLFSLTATVRDQVP